MPSSNAGISTGINIKPVTDEQVLYDKFLCDKFYLPSTHVYMQQILYDKFSYDKFYLLVASNVIVQRTTRALANHIKCSDYFNKFSLLTHTDEQNVYFDNFFYDKCTCSKASMLAFEQVHLS